ncbi:Uncharacterized protein PBTT_01889 [Plasmodiophora brassicae]|uniref:Uncharacterized protein n=1 Tax=Plasmodiophora brassicae TaxID=37360 RepID=A0A3P3Y3M4_PLABS|nr:unnamed protein product [Plasmodiophora brassicae]
MISNLSPDDQKKVQKMKAAFLKLKMQCDSMMKAGKGGTPEFQRKQTEMQKQKSSIQTIAGPNFDVDKFLGAPSSSSGSPSANGNNSTSPSSGSSPSGNSSSLNGPSSFGSPGNPSSSNMPSSGSASPLSSSGAPANQSPSSSPTGSGSGNRTNVPNGGQSPNSSNGNKSPNSSNGNQSPNSSNGNQSPNPSNGNQSPKTSNGSPTPSSSNGSKGPASSAAGSSPSAGGPNASGSSGPSTPSSSGSSGDVATSPDGVAAAVMAWSVAPSPLKALMARFANLSPDADKQEALKLLDGVPLDTTEKDQALQCRSDFKGSAMKAIRMEKMGATSSPTYQGAKTTALGAIDSFRNLLAGKVDLDGTDDMASNCKLFMLSGIAGGE